MDSRTSHSSYGRACGNCARNKCKCVIREEGGRCERCHRLNKECHPSTTHRRRPPKKPNSKTALLEEKINGLMSMLQNGSQLAADLVENTSAAISDSDNHGKISAYVIDSPFSMNGSGTDTQGQTVLTPGISAFESAGSPADNFACLYEPTSLEAEECLNTFRICHSQYFPLVNIPPETSSELLRQDRPFLWLCIIAISSKIAAHQQALNQQIKGIISQQILHQSKYSLDLFLGLLIYIGWSNLQVQSKINLSLYTQLAESMVFDLGLNKPKPKQDQLIFCECSQTFHAPRSRSMEERRAVLACFLITSIISSFVQKTDALRWTPHMDECLQILNDSPETSNDKTLVRQVRFQLIIEKVDHWQERVVESSEHIETPPSFYIQSLKLQLQEIKNQALDSSPNETVLAHFYNTNLAINEPALATLPILSDTSDFQQLECLYSCLDSIKSWFDVFFAIPLSNYVGFPYSIFSQLSHCLITLYKLSTLEDSCWPKSEVRKKADVLSILNAVINNMTQVSALAGLESTAGDNVFMKTAKRFRSIKVEWEAKLDAAVVASTGTTASYSDAAVPYDLSMSAGDDWSGDDWLNDLFVQMRN